MSRCLFLLFVFPGLVGADEKDDQLARDLVNVVRDRIGPPWSRVEATNTLGKMGMRAQVAVPELQATLLKLSGPETLPLQEAIVRTLGQIGAPAKPTIPTLTLAIGRDPDLDRLIRSSINTILVAADESDLSALVRLLKNKDEAQRLRAAKSLARFGPFGKAAVPELTLALQDSDPDVRRAAFNALRQIEGGLRPADAVSVLALDLQDKDEGIRLRAAKLLGRYGKDAAPASAALETIASSDPDPDVRKAAIEALARIAQ